MLYDYFIEKMNENNEKVLVVVIEDVEHEISEDHKNLLEKAKNVMMKDEDQIRIDTVQEWLNDGNYIDLDDYEQAQKDYKKLVQHIYSVISELTEEIEESTNENTNHMFESIRIVLTNMVIELEK